MMIYLVSRNLARKPMEHRRLHSGFSAAQIDDAILVGGTAATPRAGRRLSMDADHVLVDLEGRFERRMGGPRHRNEGARAEALAAVVGQLGGEERRSVLGEVGGDLCLNYSMRKVLKNRGAFPNDESIFKRTRPRLIAVRSLLSGSGYHRFGNRQVLRRPSHRRPPRHVFDFPSAVVGQHAP